MPWICSSLRFFSIRSLYIHMYVWYIIMNLCISKLSPVATNNIIKAIFTCVDCYCWFVCFLGVVVGVRASDVAVIMKSLSVKFFDLVAPSDTSCYKSFPFFFSFFVKHPTQNFMALSFYSISLSRIIFNTLAKN